ncbi:MAG: tetratricopeptide repeat protein [Verrucomicrobiota bacterium]|jgi:tetratricopeptide (TPR) repeat protein
MSGSSKKKTVAVHSSLPTSPAGEMPEVADSSPLKSESPAVGMNDRWLVTGVCIFLAAITFAVFGQTLGHGFVNYDDDQYVYDNPQVVQGLTLRGITWAFATSYSAYWHPLTWFSHMLDCQLWGLNAGGHHLTNVIIHAANAMLLFMVLRRMMGLRSNKSIGATTPQVRLRSEASSPQAGLRPDKGVGAAAPPAGALWPSAFVAAMFAIHPLDVESVAWVTQRKNVLSTFFWLLTMWAYTRYVEKSKVQGPKSKVFYGLALVFFALGLMSKPMLVTLPFVLLLLDYWPLGRLSGVTCQVSGSDSRVMHHASRIMPQISHLLFEKLPFLLLAVVSSVVTYLGQKSEGAMMTLEQIPLGVRLAKVPVNYVTFLRNIIWPEGLAIPYSDAPAFPVFLVVLCTLLLAGVTLLVLWAARTKPYAAVGWFWFLGTLVPVIGLVQVGNTPVADRFTYVPQVGLYLAVAWAIRDLTVSWRYRRQALGTVVTMVITALMVCAWKQTSYWRNSESLWTHALACTSGNYVAHNNLGSALFQKGNMDAAIAQYQEALQIKPNYAEIHNSLGSALFQKGSVDEAVAQYQTALQINPDYAEAHYNFGFALFKMGQVDEAIAHYQTALQIKPDYVEAHYNLGMALFKMGQVDEAIVHYQTTLQIKPDYAEAHINLGNALLQKGNVDEAIVHYQTALQIKPDDAEACYNLGNALLKMGNVDEAIAQYQKALQIKPDSAEAHNNLGNALLKKGQVDEAIAHYQKALQLKPDYAEACYNFGNALLKMGNVDEAIVHYQKALQIKPDYAEAHNNLGNILLPKGRVDEAIVHYQKALQLKPDNAVVRNNLGNALLQKGRVDEAIAQYQKAVQINPDYAEAHNNLGNILLQKGDVGEAITHLQKTLQIKPDSPDVLNNLAWLLATSPDARIRDGVQAVKYAGRACELTHYGVTLLVGTLAAAYAEAGRYDNAITAAEKACALALATGEQGLLQKNQELLALYRAQQPYHEAAGKFVPAAP